MYSKRKLCVSSGRMYRHQSLCALKTKASRNKNRQFQISIMNEYLRIRWTNVFTLPWKEFAMNSLATSFAERRAIAFTINVDAIMMSDMLNIAMWVRSPFCQHETSGWKELSCDQGRVVKQPARLTATYLLWWQHMFVHRVIQDWKVKWLIVFPGRRGWGEARLTSSHK